MIKSKFKLIITITVLLFSTFYVYSQDCIPETNLIKDVIKCDTLYLHLHKFSHKPSLPTLFR